MDGTDREIYLDDINDMGLVWMPDLFDPIHPERSLIGIYAFTRREYYYRINPVISPVELENLIEEELKDIITPNRPDLALA